MNIYEMYGRQSERTQEMVEGWSTTLQLLRDLQDGKVRPAQLVVSQTGWEVQDVGRTEDSASGAEPSSAEECTNCEGCTDQAHQDWTA